MSEEERIKTLEDELKVMKGEIKQTLVDVRAFLMEQISPINEGLQTTNVMANISAGLGGGSFGQPPPSMLLAVEDPPLQEDPEEPETRIMPSEMGGEPMDQAEPPPVSTENREEEEVVAEPLQPPADVWPVDSVPVHDTSVSPEVNLVSNLVRWVAMAKRLIGKEKLAAFLETYEMAGATVKGLDRAILRMAEIVDEGALDHPVSTAEAWSILMLHLHGILSSGGASVGWGLARWVASQDGTGSDGTDHDEVNSDDIVEAPPRNGASSTEKEANG